MMRALLRFTMAVVCLGALAETALAQSAGFMEVLRQNRYAVSARDAKLSGAGAEVLRAALAEAQFVLLGEDHGMQQIPEFTAGLCGELGPRGFHAMTLEIGPSVALEVEKFARSADGIQQMAAFDRKYPETVAFYNWREEMEALERCEESAGPAGMTLWGVDQELMGASGYLLEKIQASNLGPQSKAAIEALIKENAADYEEARKTGSPGEVFMMKAKQETLESMRETLKRDGSVEAQELFAALLESREIYQKNMSGENYASNRQRALLMKRTFRPKFTEAWGKEGKPPKVLFKFGAWHMFRGMNPMHSNELGNMATEFAESNGLKSVHILILGVKGEQAHFAGIGRPFQAAPVDLAGDKDSDFLFLKPFFENQLEGAWTMYDLRAFRAPFGKFGKVDDETERMVFGYDFLVLIPHPTASHGAGEAAQK